MAFPIEQRANKGKSPGRGSTFESSRSENEARELGKKKGPCLWGRQKAKKEHEATVRKVSFAEAMQTTYEARKERDGLGPSHDR